MFYIIETNQQLARLDPQKSCYIEIITANDNYHPALSSLSLIYYRAEEKGYIFSIDHSEAFLRMQKLAGII